MATCWMEIFTKRELSYGVAHFMPSGKKRCSSVRRSRTACAVASALPEGASWIPMAVDGCPLRRADVA